MSQVWNVALMALVWMQNHPAESIMVAGALCSALQGWFDKVPLMGKLGRVMSGLGVNVVALKAEFLPKVPAVIGAVEKAVEAKVAGK
jgi:hypothetical protein